MASSDPYPAVVAAIAQRLATALPTDPPSGLAIRVAGEAVTLTIATLAGSGKTQPVKMPRLRFDRVVVRLTDTLRGARDDCGPDDALVALTVTAPIRLPGRTASALVERMRSLVATAKPGAEVQDTVHGNRVRMRLLPSPATAPKLLGFVHHADDDAHMLLATVAAWLAMAAAIPWSSRRRGERWLAIGVPAGGPWSGFAAAMLAQTGTVHDFRRILLVSPDGRSVELPR